MNEIEEVYEELRNLPRFDGEMQQNAQVERAILPRALGGTSPSTQGKIANAAQEHSKSQIENPSTSGAGSNRTGHAASRKTFTTASANRLAKSRPTKARDLDPVRDPNAHDAYNRGCSDEALLRSYNSRKARGKPTWQMERELRKRRLSS